MVQFKVKFIAISSIFYIYFNSGTLSATSVLAPRIKEASKDYIRHYLTKERSQDRSGLFEKEIRTVIGEAYRLERKEQTPALVVKLIEVHLKGKENLERLKKLRFFIKNQKKLPCRPEVSNKKLLLKHAAQLNLKIHENHQNLLCLQTRGKIKKPKILHALRGLINIKEQELNFVKSIVDFVKQCKKKPFKKQEKRNKSFDKNVSVENNSLINSNGGGADSQEVEIAPKRTKLSRFKGKGSAKELKGTLDSFLISSSEEPFFRIESGQKEHPFFRDSGVFLWGEDNSQIVQLNIFYEFLSHKIQENKLAVVHLLLERVPCDQKLTLDELITRDLKSLALLDLFKEWEDSGEINFDNLLCYLMLVEEKVGAGEIVRPKNISLDLIEGENSKEANFFCLQLNKLFSSINYLKKTFKKSSEKSGSRLKLDILGWETAESLKPSSSEKESQKAINLAIFKSLKSVLKLYPNIKFPHDSFILRASAFHVPLYQSLYFLNKLVQRPGIDFNPDFLVHALGFNEEEKSLILEAVKNVLEKTRSESLSCEEFLILLQKTVLGKNLLSFDPSSFIDEHYCVCIPSEEIFSFYQEFLVIKNPVEVTLKGAK